MIKRIASAVFGAALAFPSVSQAEGNWINKLQTVKPHSGAEIKALIDDLGLEPLYMGKPKGSISKTNPHPYRLYGDGEGGNWLLLRRNASDKYYALFAGEFYTYTPIEEKPSAETSKMSHDRCLSLQSSFFNYATHHVFQGLEGMRNHGNTFISLFQGNGRPMQYFNSSQERGIIYKEVLRKTPDAHGEYDCWLVQDLNITPQKRFDALTAAGRG